jgi:hypothetical protein
MDISLNKFKSHVSDIARPNRFWVSIGDPANSIIVAGADNNASLSPWKEKHEFLAKSAQLPGRTVNNVVINWQGMQYNIAGDPTFNDMNLTFLNNYEFDLRKFFENWMEVIVQMETNERSQPGSYKSDVIELKQLGRTSSDVLATYRLIGAYPTDISAIDLSQDQSDGQEDITVSLKYDYFEKIN